MYFREEEKVCTFLKSPKSLPLEDELSWNAECAAFWIWSLYTPGWSWVSCAVLQKDNFCLRLRLGQSSSFKWSLSTTRIFWKCIETVHPGKCDFTGSKTLDMVIKRLNMWCLFSGKSDFFLLHFWSWAKLSLYRIFWVIWFWFSSGKLLFHRQ